MADVTTSTVVDDLMQAADAAGARTAIGAAAASGTESGLTAGAATVLANTRTIGGSNFNGSGNVTSFPSPGAIGGTTPAPGSFTTLTSSGLNTVTGATARVGTPVVGDVIDFTKGNNTQSLTGDVTWTFSGATVGHQFTFVTITTDGTPRTVTLPATVYPDGSSAALASFVVPASCTKTVVLEWISGTAYRIFNNPVLTSGTGSTFLLAAGSTPSSMVGTNITGTAAGLTAGNVTTNANLTGPVTSTGNATVMKCLVQVACSDQSTAITTGTAKATFRMPHAMTVTDVRASVNTAPTGSTLVIDINEAGTTILSTKLSIDATEKTSTTAATPPVISDASLADDAEITIDFDQVGSTIAGTGVVVTIIGTRSA